MVDSYDMNGIRQVIHGGVGFWAEENGPTITEYAVLLVLVVFGVFTLLTLIGMFLKSSFTSLSSGLPES